MNPPPQNLSTEYRLKQQNDPTAVHYIDHFLHPQPRTHPQTPIAPPLPPPRVSPAACQPPPGSTCYCPRCLLLPQSLLTAAALHTDTNPRSQGTVTQAEQGHRCWTAGCSKAGVQGLRFSLDASLTQRLMCKLHVSCNALDTLYTPKSYH